MKKIIVTIMILVAAQVFLSPAVHSEQAQKNSRPAQEDRIKKLEDRVDAAEKAASAAAIERDYVTRTQKFYESYYQKILNTQMWTIAIVGLILTGVFVVVARFSLKMVDERTKLVTAEATVQMRNEYGRAIAKEVQKLWDSNTADIKKLKETMTAQFAELEQNLRDRSDFQAQFVQGLGSGAEERHDDSLVNFRQALHAYKSGKSRNLFESKVGATTVRFLFESIRKAYGGDNYVDKAREELADPLYNDIQEELALAALQLSWLTPLINERFPAPPAPPAPATSGPVVEPRPVALTREVSLAESDLALDEESDSCRLITT